MTFAPAHSPPLLVDQLKEGEPLVLLVGERGGTQKQIPLMKTAGGLRQKEFLDVPFAPLIRPGETD